MERLPEKPIRLVRNGARLGRVYPVHFVPFRFEHLQQVNRRLVAKRLLFLRRRAVEKRADRLEAVVVVPAVGETQFGARKRIAPLSSDLLQQFRAGFHVVGPFLIASRSPTGSAVGFMARTPWRSVP